MSDPNTDLSTVMPKILARGLLSLRERAVMPRLVNVGYGAEAAEKGDTIDVPIAPTLTAVDAGPSPTFTTTQDASPSKVQITMTNWKSVPFSMSDKSMVELDRNRHFLPLAADAAIKTLANIIDVSVHDTYPGVYGFVGTAGDTPFSTISDATGARVILNKQLAPLGDRRMVIDPDAEGNALALDQLAAMDKVGEDRPRIEGEMGRKLGFDWVMSQNVRTHTAGGLTSAVVASTTAAGATSLDVSQLIGTTAALKVGDIFSIAGNSQTYTVTASVNVATAAVAVSISPALVAIATSQAVITVRASHVVNLAFHRDAFALAMRPLQQDTASAALGSLITAITDAETGLALRLEVSRQNKQNTWDFDALWGTKLVRAQLATRVAG